MRQAAAVVRCRASMESCTSLDYCCRFSSSVLHVLGAHPLLLLLLLSLQVGVRYQRTASVPWPRHQGPGSGP
jgi:hypothetical protein